MQVGILIGGILKRGHKGGKNGSKLIISRDGSVLFPFFFVSFGLYLDTFLPHLLPHRHLLSIFCVDYWRIKGMHIAFEHHRIRF